MTLANNNIIRLSVVWDVGNVMMVNVHHFKLTGIVAQTQTQIRADITEHLEGSYAFVTSLITSFALHQRNEIFNITAGGPETPMSSNGNLDGTAGGEVLPSQVAMEVFFRTAVSRRIGKTFLPVMTEALITNGVIGAAALAAGGNFAGAIVGGVALTNGVIVTKGVYNRSGAIFSDITDVEVPDRLRTQRRRRVGVGA